MGISIYDLPIRIIQSKRKTIAIEIKDNEILVKTPNGMSRQEIVAFIYQKREWIEKHWQVVQERNQKMEQMEPYTMEEIRALAEKALVVIPKKVKYYADLIGVDYGKITIRNQKTRWGSCSSKGNLNFNCLLMLMADEVIDSIVVHELCHRKYMDHSPWFYAEIEKVFPEYKKCQKWLKENGGIYLRRLP